MNIPSRILCKTLASAVTMTLLITAPGLPCYQVMAQTYSGANAGVLGSNIGSQAVAVAAIPQAQANMALSNQMAYMNLVGNLGNNIPNIKIQRNAPGRTIVSRVSLMLPGAAQNPATAKPANLQQNKKGLGIVESLAETSKKFEILGKDSKATEATLLESGKNLFDGSGMRALETGSDFRERLSVGYLKGNHGNQVEESKFRKKLSVDYLKTAKPSADPMIYPPLEKRAQNQAIDYTSTYAHRGGLIGGAIGGIMGLSAGMWYTLQYFAQDPLRAVLGGLLTITPFVASIAMQLFHNWGRYKGFDIGREKTIANYGAYLKGHRARIESIPGVTAIRFRWGLPGRSDPSIDAGGPLFEVLVDRTVPIETIKAQMEKVSGISWFKVFYTYDSIADDAPNGIYKTTGLLKSQNGMVSFGAAAALLLGAGTLVLTMPSVALAALSPILAVGTGNIIGTVVGVAAGIIAALVLDKVKDYDLTEWGLLAIGLVIAGGLLGFAAGGLIAAYSLAPMLSFKLAGGNIIGAVAGVVAGALTGLGLDKVKSYDLTEWAMLTIGLMFAGGILGFAAGGWIAVL